MPNDAQDFVFTAGGGLCPVQLHARRRLRRDAVEHPHVRERDSRRRATRCRRPCRAAGTRPAPPVTTAARSRTSTSRPGRSSPARSTTASAASIVVVKDAHPERPAGLLLHGRRRPLAASFSSTTTPTARCRTRARSPTCAAGSGYSRLGDRADRLGPDQRHLRRRQPGLEHRRRAGRDRHLHVREPQARAASSWSRTPCRTTRRTSPSRPAAASRPRASRSTTTPTARCPTRSTFNDLVPGVGLLAVADAAEPAGTWPPPPVTTAARCRTSTSRPGRPSPARSRTSSTADHGRQGRAARTTRRTSPSPRAAASARPASSSTTTPTGRCRTRARSATCRRRRGYSLVRDRAAGWDLIRAPPATTAARCRTSTSRPAEHVTCTFTNRKRGQIVVVQDSQPERPAGLLVHGGRRPQPRELPARRRLRRDPVEHAHVRQRAGRERLLDLRRPCRAAGTWRAPPATTAARCRTSTSAPARPSPARSRTDKRGTDRGGQGRDPERPAGLLVHRGRRPSPGQLPARRRLRRHAVEHAHVRRRHARLRLLGGRDARAERLDPGERDLHDGSPVSNIDVHGGRDRHLHVPEPAWIPAAEGRDAAEGVDGPRLRELHRRRTARTARALEFPSCNPPAQSSAHLTVGTPDANSARGQHGRQRAVRGDARQSRHPGRRGRRRDRGQRHRRAPDGDARRLHGRAPGRGCPCGSPTA